MASHKVKGYIYVKKVNNPSFSCNGCFCIGLTFGDLQRPQMSFLVKYIYVTSIHMVKVVLILENISWYLFIVKILLKEGGIASRPTHLLCPARQKS